MEILDPEIYARAKAQVYAKYKTHGAYRSGALVQLYKQMGGRYSGNKKKAPLKRWFAEQWTDVGNKQYPVYRPTVRVSQDTPLLVSEIDKQNLQKQIALKQKYRNKRNLPAFVKKV